MLGLMIYFSLLFLMANYSDFAETVSALILFGSVMIPRKKEEISIEEGAD